MKSDIQIAQEAVMEPITKKTKMLLFMVSKKHTQPIL